MKTLITFLVFLYSTFALASTPELIDTCKLSSMDPSDMSVEGTFTVTKVADTLYLSVDATFSIPDDETSTSSGQDMVSLQKTYTGDELKEVINTDDAARELARRLGADTPESLTVYQGKNFEDDGAGLALYRLQGKETTKGIAFVGWAPVYCD